MLLVTFIETSIFYSIILFGDKSFDYYIKVINSY